MAALSSGVWSERFCVAENLKVPPITRSRRTIHPPAFSAIPMHRGYFVLGERMRALGTPAGKKWVGIQQFQLFLQRPPLPWLQNEFAVVVAGTFWFPQFIGFEVGVSSKIGASVGGWARGMDGTDEVGVAGVELAAIAFG